MVTIHFSASPEVLVEEVGTAITLRSQLDQAPPADGPTATIKDNVPQSLARYTVDPDNSALVQFADRRLN